MLAQNSGTGYVSSGSCWFCFAVFCFLWWDLNYVSTFAKSNVKNITLPQMHHVSLLCMLWADIHYKTHSNSWTWQMAFQAALTGRPWSSVGTAVEWTARELGLRATLSLESMAGPFSLWCTVNEHRPSDYWLYRWVPDWNRSSSHYASFEAV